MQKILNFIGGEMRAPVSGRYFETDDPAVGAPYALVPDSGAEDLELAVAAAKKAFPAWRDTPAAGRAKALRNLADMIEKNRAGFARAECIDNGRPVAACTAVNIMRGSANLRFFADEAVRFSGEKFKTEKIESYTLPQPLGVVATISPWNLPMLLFTWKFAPALAAGNCVIAKPSEVTPMTAYMLANLANDAGIPGGVFNVLHGKGANIGAAITAHPDIPAISFTGGTVTGTTIYAAAARQLKKVSLELGGKNPTVVFNDADLDKTAEGAIAAGFSNQGQICLCGSRLLVQEGIYEDFKKAFIARAKEIKIGDPLLEETQHGPMVSKAHMEKVLDYIGLAQREGGKVLTGGKRCIVDGRCKGGWFIEPTIIEGLPMECRANQEEIFGPVVTIMPFKTEDEAVALANGVEYGLAASVWTEDRAKADRVAAKIESGIVWQNCWNARDLRTPFGGVKKSGVGREGGRRALEFFTEEKTISRIA
ncbi:MAG: aldehyde dehydrogenase [Alphaproteobacteria bacterium]|nr:aldehyde dehydrogenase [Alphaproteobacteria bacterium]